MARRALLIGSQTGGLSAPERDVERMHVLLTQIDFEVAACTGQAATRDAILAAYRQLIASTTSSDAVLVYYSGHGGLAPNPDWLPFDNGMLVGPRFYQFIVPYDIDDSTAEDFRGITDLELSTLQQALTERTRNVTVILDCCHSARMSRDRALVPRALPRPWLVGLSSRLADLRARGLQVNTLAAESNPYAVRVVACGPRQSAFEYEAADGKTVGLLTESLLLSLRDAVNNGVSWANLGRRLRQRVLEIEPTQRPDVEGPVERAVLDMARVDDTGVLSVRAHAGELVLSGGRLWGVDEGDTYTIVGSNRPVGEAVVTWVEADRAGIQVIGSSGEAHDGASAVPLAKAVRRYAIRLDGPRSSVQRLERAIEVATRVRVSSDHSETLAGVELTPTDAVIVDRSGQPLSMPRPLDDAGVNDVVHSLDAYARAQAVLELQSGQGGERLTSSITLEWGRVVDGKAQALAQSGEILFSGESIYVRIANPPDGSTVYCSLFDVSPSGQIALLTRSEPSGVELHPGEDYVIGADRRTSRLTGLPVSWPARVPALGQRVETLLLVASDRPQDLRALEQRGVRSESVRASSLRRIVDQLGYGGARDIQPEASGHEEVHYAVEHITFLLDPGPPPARDESSFVIDDRPDLSIVYRASRASAPASAVLALRLTDLIVHRNRRLFGSAFSGDVRVDTVVVTGPSGGDQPIYRMETARFSGIRDGDRLPFDNLLVFHGSASAFIDVGVWVSRDQRDSPGLSELLQRELNSKDFKNAALILAGLAVAAPQATAAVAAIGAAATICNISARLLSAALGTSIGLYRTTLLAQEGFGQGRHPASGAMRAQDFSFGYEVLAVDVTAANCTDEMRSSA